MKSEAQLQRAASERVANLAAQQRGEPLPFPNPWDKLDPTKLDASQALVTQDANLRSTRAFMQLPPLVPDIRS